LAAVSVREAHFEAMLRLRTPITVLLLLAATALVAACGGSSGSSGATAGTGTNAAGGTAAGAGPGGGGAQGAAFQKCLKDHGLTLPGRGAGGAGGPGYGGPGGGNGQPPNGGPGGGGGNPAFQKAMAACGKLRPQGTGQGGGGAGPGGGAGQSITAFVPYLNCLKTKGLAVDVKQGFNALRSLKRDDPKVQAALTSCQSKLPQRPQRSQGTPPAGSTTSGTT
jgi:hypothetical protein